MYIISFNIMFKDDRKIILTETPYLFVNDNLRKIIEEIRHLIYDDFVAIAEQMKIPPNKLALGMTTFSTEQKSMHFFEVDAYKVRELQKSLER